MASDACGKCLLFILAILLPPVAVWIARDKICSCMVCLNIILTLIGWIPGIIHAFAVICCCSRYQVHDTA
ncbi:unnamed protein product [Rotaria magnacalcarata]|uniref:Plasma membrane proteolipid 3 n=1 Tax=Rotaria magnacalcarata TaxID=392030 RepID=A0A816UMD9_9BILA|nr:unnamed protein product [Rotaria magnacalcarata]CAF2116058.1 unnamed protein product [Rotaria magnacalcarata]CAF3878579.1 unnamed protein product [Rotaria magnacalcarata]CAF3905909.1 unnamed protein product [Rotaria magnacalcarata]